MQYKPQNKEELKKLVDDQSIYLGDIDTSLITDMSFLFEDTEREDFSGIEKWDVSKVENMSWMFKNANAFNQPIGNWDVSGVESMSHMFYGAKSFNQPLEKWDVSNVKDMFHMFFWAERFNQPLDSWDVSNVRIMSHMFCNAKSFNQPLNSWNVRAEYKDKVFNRCPIDEKFKPKVLQNNQRKNNRG